MPLLPRYFLRVTYRGTRYHGWQVQPKSVTVQGVLEDRLSRLLQQDIRVFGAGRTDSGVHASEFYAHMTLPGPLADIPGLLFRLNNFLPKDIGVTACFRVTGRANARFDAILREYKYYLMQQKDPFWTETALFHPHALDWQAMQQAAGHLLRYTDFTSFAAAGGNVRTNICYIQRADWQQEGSRFVFTIQANRFLRKMVRGIVGTLLEVGRGKISPEGFGQIIAGQNRSFAGPSAAPQGLFLTRIVYPRDILYPGLQAVTYSE